jgi:hypothetical protein
MQELTGKAGWEQGIGTVTGQFDVAHNVPGYRYQRNFLPSPISVIRFSSVSSVSSVVQSF